MLSENVIKTEKGIRFNVRVVPKSSKNLLCAMSEDVIKLKITAPPVDGKANAACIKYFADILCVPKNQIALISGLKSKTKTFEITGDPDLLYSILKQAINQE
jgi:uncharacterized protein (TIGR00251 family)